MEAGTEVIGYARCSTAEQAAGGHGMDAQEVAIRAEVERRGWVLVGIVRDEASSAEDTDQTGLLSALAQVRDGQAGVGARGRQARSPVPLRRGLRHDP